MILIHAKIVPIYQEILKLIVNVNKGFILNKMYLNANNVIINVLPVFRIKLIV